MEYEHKVIVEFEVVSANEIEAYNSVLNFIKTAALSGAYYDFHKKAVSTTVKLPNYGIERQ